MLPDRVMKQYERALSEPYDTVSHNYQHNICTINVRL